MSKQSDAVREYFDKNGILRKDVSEILGVTSGTLSSILSGRYGISKKVAHKLAAAYGFDIEFLLTGEGELCPPPGTIRIRQSQRVSGNGTIVNSAGNQTINGDAALAIENAQLRDRITQLTAEKDRLLGIIETLTKK